MYTFYIKQMFHGTHVPVGKPPMFGYMSKRIFSVSGLWHEDERTEAKNAENILNWGYITHVFMHAVFSSYEVKGNRRVQNLTG